MFLEIPSLRVQLKPIHDWAAFHRGLKVNRWLATLSFALKELSCSKDQQTCDKYLDKLRSPWINMSIGNRYCAAGAMPAVKVSTINLLMCFIVWSSARSTVVHGGVWVVIGAFHQSSQSQVPLPNNHQPLLTFVTALQLFSPVWLDMLACLPACRVFNNGAVILWQKRSSI